RPRAQRPDHIGANHYYIHVMEGSPHPEKALPAAERLEKLAPAAGHLPHMSAHIYIRTGDYPRAARANEAAVRADEALPKSEEATFYSVAYYGHNLHFLAVANALAGNSTRAIAAAKKLYAHSERWTKEATQLDFFMVTPAIVLIQFGRWDDILALPRPPPEVPLTAVIWHFARTPAPGAGRRAHARARFQRRREGLPRGSRAQPRERARTVRPAGGARGTGPHGRSRRIAKAHCSRLARGRCEAGPRDLEMREDGLGF